MLKKLEILLDNEIDPAFASRAQFIFEEIEKKKPLRVLDIGCGRGFYVNALSLYRFPKEIVGADVNKSYLEKAREQISDRRVRFMEGSVYSIPFRDRYFDLVICSELLEHLSNDKKGLSEIFRVLRPGGILLLSVPSKNFPLTWDPLNYILMHLLNTHINKNIWFLAGIWADHERLYGIEELTQKVIKAGFDIKKLESFIGFSWPFTHFLLYGIGKNLIERFGASSFNRFEFKENKYKLFLAKLFSIPTKVMTNSQVNIVVAASKPT